MGKQKNKRGRRKNERKGIMQREKGEDDGLKVGKRKKAKGEINRLRMPYEFKVGRKTWRVKRELK